MMVHDYKAYPELTNTQLEENPFASPHPQYTEDFEAVVERVHDGDTITLNTSDRDFLFPLRLLDIDAPEMNAGGKEARDWLRERILGQEITVIMDPNMRVGKYGRLLGRVFFGGFDVGEEMMQRDLVKSFGEDEGEFDSVSKIFRLEAWL